MSIRIVLLKIAAISFSETKLLGVVIFQLSKEHVKQQASKLFNILDIFYFRLAGYFFIVKHVHVTNTVNGFIAVSLALFSLNSTLVIWM